MVFCHKNLFPLQTPANNEWTSDGAYEKFPETAENLQKLLSSVMIRQGAIDKLRTQKVFKPQFDLPQHQI